MGADQLCSLLLKWEQLKYKTVDASSVSLLAWGQENVHVRSRNPGQGNVLPTEEGKSMWEGEEAGETVPVTGSANKTLKAGEAGALGVPPELLGSANISRAKDAKVLLLQSNRVYSSSDFY